ncbi:hypothetical protein RUND412_001273 [Rhizina undulata]
MAARYHHNQDHQTPYYEIEEEIDYRQQHHPRTGDYDLPTAPVSISTVVPAYSGIYASPHGSRNALIPNIYNNVIEEPVVEHEHHHVHHHIDHGNVNAQISASRRREYNNDDIYESGRTASRRREYNHDEVYDLDRRYGNANLSLSHSHHGHGHRRNRSTGDRSVGSSRIFHEEIDLNLDRARYDRRDANYAVIDVVPGTRRVTVDMSHSGDREINWRRDNGIRRSRGLGNELWTEITKDLVTREAIEELGYQFEETEFFYYIFEYLDQDQLAELVGLTSGIRHQRVKDIEYESIAGTSRSLRGNWDDTRTEIVIEGNRRRRYYY